MNQAAPTLEQMIAEAQAEQAQKDAKALSHTEGQNLPTEYAPDAPRRYRKLHADTLAKYQAVAAEYLKNGFNKTKAYAAIYPDASPATAATEGKRVLDHPQIEAFLRTVWERVSDRAEVSASYVLGQWLNQSEANVADYLESDGRGGMQVRDITQLPRDVQKRLRSIDVSTNERVQEDGTTITSSSIKMRTVDAQRAQENLAKVLGILRDQQDINVTVNTGQAIADAFTRLKTVGKLPPPAITGPDEG